MSTSSFTIKEERVVGDNRQLSMYLKDCGNIVILTGYTFNIEYVQASTTHVAVGTLNNGDGRVHFPVTDISSTVGTWALKITGTDAASNPIKPIVGSIEFK